MKANPSKSGCEEFRPLVVGAPRTGFTLLINVIAHLLPLSRHVVSKQRSVLRAFIDIAGSHIADAVVGEARAHGKSRDLVFNPNFRSLAGGPRWVPPETPNVACFRKYVGIRGHGDFTLITRHPRAIFDMEDILHTHSYPAYWVSNSAEAKLIAFASQRSPIGTLYSSCFSLNALASEYLQHFVPLERDNDELREQLALYKLTDLKFFGGLISPLARYLEEFIDVRHRYRYVMLWEDLLTHPTRTIIEIGAAMGIVVDESFATDIWKDMSWRNLTGWHKHNYRRGHGIVGGWRRYLTNEHLALMRDMGLERLSLTMGYGPIGDLVQSDYTPYQRRVAHMLARGEVFHDYPDRWMFEFAFNKSNLDSSAFSFKRYGWRDNTQVERSSVDREDLVMAMWDAAEAAAARVNHALAELLAVTENDLAPVTDIFRDFARSHAGLLDRPESAAHAVLHDAWMGKGVEPVLVRTFRGCNIVKFGQTYYGLPQALGPIDLRQTDPSKLPGVIEAGSYESLNLAIDATAEAG